MSTSVTFDSNVWENIVDENKRNTPDQICIKLYELIKNGSITPYFFEGLATIEVIGRRDRKEYVSNYKAGFSMSIDGEEVALHPGSGGPVISDYLKILVPRALELGFRFIKLRRIGAPSLDIPERHFAPDAKYCMKERQARTSQCMRFIEDVLKAGRGQLMSELDPTDGGLVHRTQNDGSLTTKKYSELVSEWSDGDALAAHYGYGIDFFCTNDRASGAGSSSIFYPTNLQKLEQRYPVNVVSPERLVLALGVTSA
ncbi:MAG: hypothetical protein MRJ68_16370 [Nitrospira sp.]|nr:hypothetical protein [Nitrospira sp.]